MDARGARRRRAAPAIAQPPASAPAPTTSGLPALAGGSPELDVEPVPAPLTTRPQPEVVFVAVLAGAATVFFGIIPQPLFNLVAHAGGALGGLF